MKIALLISTLMLVTKLSGQESEQKRLPLPVALFSAGSFGDFDSAKVIPMSLRRGLMENKTNISFIVDTPKLCPPEFTNVIANTNLFSSVEKKLLTEIPLVYASVTTNSGPPNSVFLGCGKESWPLTEHYRYAIFQLTNFNAQVKVFFVERHKGSEAWISDKKEWLIYRDSSGSGYDVSFFDNGSIQSFRQFKHNQLNGIWADFDGDHCSAWMRFIGGRAFGNWLVWNRSGSLYMEAEFKLPFDFIGQIDFSP